jgi:hypothetical protein
VYQWCGFKFHRGKNTNLTALNSNSNTVWFNVQMYTYIYIWQIDIIKECPNTQNKVFNYFSLCFVYLVLFYKPFKTFIIYFTCIVSLYRNDPTPRKIDRWLVVQTMYIYVYLEKSCWELVFIVIQNPNSNKVFLSYLILSSLSRTTTYWAIPGLNQTFKVVESVFSSEMVREVVPQSCSCKHEWFFAIPCSSNLRYI